MPNKVIKLSIDRVDLVDEGANSASFIELIKRRRPETMDVQEILSKMRPEEASVLQTALTEKDAALAKSNELIASNNATSEAELAKRDSTISTLNGQLETVTKAKAIDTEEELIKSMPENVRKAFTDMKLQKETAEEAIRKAKEASDELEAITKSKELQALNASDDELVSIVKGCSPEVFEILKKASKQVEDNLLTPVGKSHLGGAASDSWDRINKSADALRATDSSLTKEQAVTKVLTDNPALYDEYLQGGAK